MENENRHDSVLAQGEKDGDEFEKIVLDDDDSDDCEDREFDVDELTSDEEDLPVFEVNELTSSSSESEREPDLEETPTFPKDRIVGHPPRVPGTTGITDEAYSKFLSAFEESQTREDEELRKWLLDDEEDYDWDYSSEAAKLLEVSDEYRNDTAVRVSKTELIQLVKDHWKSEEAKWMSQEKTEPIEKPEKVVREQNRTARAAIKQRQLAPAWCRDRIPQPLINAAMAETFQSQMKTHLQLLVQMILLSRQRAAASKSSARLTTAEALLLQFKQMRDISFQYRHIYGYACPPQTPSSSDWRSLTILSLTHQFLMRMRGAYPNETEQGRIIEVFSNFFPEYENSLLPDYTESKADHSTSELTGLERLDLDRWGFDRELFDSLVDSNRFTWTTAEDYLLSLEIARRGKDLVYTTLLPTKTYAEIKRRYAELTRRRAPQNAVKDIESLMQRPLSLQEWRLVDRGVMQYGLHRWDMIQAHLLPGRDKVILERLYHRRTKKRAQKRKERERAREKKMAEAGGKKQTIVSKR